MKKIIVAMSGASGLLLGKSLVACLASSVTLKAQPLELHLIISEGMRRVAAHEGGAGLETLEEIKSLAHAVHDPADLAAPMAGGSWRHDGMVVCPCSMSSLAAIANGCGTNLIHRAADVCLKERFPLILAVRETPLSRVHLANMLAASDAGAVIMPPVPAFYAGLSTLEEAARHFSVRIMDQLGLKGPEIRRWGA